MSTGAIRAGRAYVEIGAKDKLTNFLKTSEKRLQSFARGVSMIGGGMAAMGGAGVAAIAGVTSVFSGFDAGMAAVRANTGATGEQLAALRNTAKDLGASTKFSATEAASGMNELAKAGFSANEILAGIPATLSLAAAGGIELGEAAEIAANVSGAFGLAADEIGRVSDVIATTANVSTTGVLEMGETFKYVAPLAKVAGQSIEEMAAASAILAANGTKGSMAGTDLKGILSKLATSDVQEQFKELGVEVVDATGKMRPMMDVMRDYGEATASMTDSERISNAVGVFGEISAKSAIAISTAGDAIDEMRDKMNGSAGAAATMASVMEDSLGGSITTFKSAVESVVIELGEALAPAIRKIIDFASTFLRGVTKLVKENQGLVLAAAGVVVAIAGIGSALVGTGAVIAAFGVILGVASTGFSIMFSIIAAILSPVGLLVASIAALGAYLLYTSDVGTKALQWLASKFSVLRDDAIVAWKAISDAVKSGDLKQAWQVITAFLELTWIETTASLQDIWADTMRFFLDAGSVTAQAIASSFQALSGVLDSLMSKYSKVYDAVYDTVLDVAGGATGVQTIGATTSASQNDAVLNAIRGFTSSAADFGKIMGEEAAGKISERDLERQNSAALRKRRADELRGMLSGSTAEATPDSAPTTETASTEKKIDSEESLESIFKKHADQMKEPPAIDPSEIEDPLGDMANIPSGDSLLNTSGQSNAGTFSSAAAALMGAGAGGGPMNRVAKATERSQELLETIDKNMAVTAKWEGMVHTA